MPADELIRPIRGGDGPNSLRPASHPHGPLRIPARGGGGRKSGRGHTDDERESPITESERRELEIKVEKINAELAARGRPFRIELAHERNQEILALVNIETNVRLRSFSAHLAHTISAVDIEMWLNRLETGQGFLVDEDA